MNLLNVRELATDRGAKAVVDQKGNLGAVRLDRGDCGELGIVIIDLSLEVLRGKWLRCLCVQGDDRLGRGGSLLSVEDG